MNIVININMYNSIWYDSLIKPFLSPPDWIFRLVWIILYFMILVAFMLFVLSKKENKKLGYIYFTLQLVLNFLWSPAFFLMQNILLSLVIILLILIFTILTMKEFYPVSKLAVVLLIPYLLWVIFAAYLNTGYLFLNYWYVFIFFWYSFVKIIIS